MMNVEERRMDAKTQSHSWWFNSHNSPKCSPWLESTLAELNEKTKTMLKLVEDDADSFAQRAEMYYKKRPELIGMVEDFYRAHRSLAERYDQLRTDRCVRRRSPLRSSLSLPKDEYENVFDSYNSVKSFDSFTEVAYSSEDAAESEVDDPEDDVSERDQEERGEEKPLHGLQSFEEDSQLKDELNRLREENEFQKNQIKQKDQEIEEISLQLSKNAILLQKMNEELEAVKEKDLYIVVKRTIDDLPTEDLKIANHVTENLKLHDEPEQVKPKGEEEPEYMMQFEDEYELEVKLKNEVDLLRLKYMKQAEMVNQKDKENIELAKKLEEAKYEILNIQAEYVHLQDALTLKEMQFEGEKEEMTKLLKQLEATKSELVQLRDDAQKDKNSNDILMLKEDQLKHAEDEISQLKSQFKRITQELSHLRGELQRKSEHLVDALAEKDEELKISQLKSQFKRITQELRHLRGEIQRKDEQLVNALAEKDEEKRAVIRQLSLAMEILREDNQFLKHSLMKNSPKKRRPSQFQLFKGVQSKLFSARV